MPLYKDEEGHEYYYGPNDLVPIGLNLVAEQPAGAAKMDGEQITLDVAVNPLLKKAAKKQVEVAPSKDLNASTIYGIYGCAHGERTLTEATRFMGGLEVEVEGVPKNKYTNHNIFAIKEDGSLRNNGVEYVSSPQPREVLTEGFKNLHQWLQLDPKQDPFSHRTSIHVHVNVASLTGRETKNMLLLYALFEDFFFSMVKPERRANIHCVPLTETHLPAYYHRDIHYLRQKWSKYSALNLCRLSDLGTLEFRHHHGTGDVEAVATWLKVLDNLWTLSRQVVIDEDALSDPNRLHAWFSTIFQPSPRTMMLGGQLMNIIGNSLIDVKFSTIKE